MENLFTTLPFLTAYQPAFMVLAVQSLIVLLQNFLTAPLAYAKEEQVPGMPLKHDHSRLSFRAVRTFQNSAETLPAFFAAVLIAIAAGVSPLLVNVAAGVHLASRFAFWGIYYSGKGRIAGGPRTAAFVVGLLANIVIAIAAIVALI